MNHQSPTMASQATAELPKPEWPMVFFSYEGWNDWSLEGLPEMKADGHGTRLAFSADQMNAHYLAGVEAGRASRAQSEWKPIETAPAAGYFLVCDEYGESVRTKLRHDGEWLDVEYPFIEHAPWGDKSVGLDAQRILDSAQRDPLSPMKLRVSDGCPNPNYWCALPPFHATLGETK